MAKWCLWTRVASSSKNRLPHIGSNLVSHFELSGYASDITRTYPISSSGQFTAPQRELYSAILGVQKDLINLCTEDAHESLNSLHTKSVEMLGKALTDIGFDLGAGNRQIDRLYPHFLSHPIGIGEFVAVLWTA